MGIRLALLAALLAIDIGAMAAGGASAASAGDPVERAGQPVIPAAGTDQRKSGDDVVCRRERPLGTRLGRTVCRSRADMEASAEQARRMVNKPVANTSRGD